MLLLAPTLLIDDLPLYDVLTLAVDRAALRAVEHHGDLGPHTVFADVPERRTTITIRRRLDADEALDLVPGESVALAFFTHAGTGDAHRLRYTTDAVVLSTRTEFDARAHASSASASASAVRTITLVALSPDGGAADPFIIEPAPLIEP